MTAASAELQISCALREYLNAIYQLSVSRHAVRITDISNHMGISKPSVNRAVNALKRAGLVSHEPYGCIYLTEKGTEEGMLFLERSKTVSGFLAKALDLPQETADSAAVKIASELSDDIIEKMKIY